MAEFAWYMSGRKGGKGEPKQPPAPTPVVTPTHPALDPDRGGLTNPHMPPVVEPPRPPSRRPKDPGDPAH